MALKTELGEDSWKVIQHLADQRLVVTGQDTAGNEIAEVVHEALIQKWGRFREWMEADRAFRLWQERLRSNMRQWRESGQDEGALLSGAPLAVAEGWLSGAWGRAELCGNWIHTSQPGIASQAPEGAPAQAAARIHRVGCGLGDRPGPGGFRTIPAPGSQDAGGDLAGIPG